MRQVALTTSKGGITRLRTKGAALNDSLYDLKNGYVTAARTIKMRPGTRRLHELPAGTAGLVNFNGRLRTFSTVPIDGMPEDVDLTVLRSPDATAETPLGLTAIHFAKPFLGALYIAAEFEDGNTYHFWLEEAQEWEPDTAYRFGSLVQPTTGSTGVVFRARRGDTPRITWAPDVARAVNDEIEPTVFNNFFYTVVATTGDNPRSGPVEPDWPTIDGAQITESPDGAAPGVVEPAPVGSDPADSPSPETSDRYGSSSGGGEGDLRLK